MIRLTVTLLWQLACAVAEWAAFIWILKHLFKKHQ